jgi:hypothetical protein
MVNLTAARMEFAFVPRDDAPRVIVDSRMHHEVTRMHDAAPE